MPIVRKEQRELPCMLTQDELADASSTLAAKTMEIVELEDRKKSVAADYKAKIDVMSAANNVLARKIHSKTELRQVTCEWMFDWEGGTKKLIRTDTGEQVASDFIKDYELQTHFDDLKKESEAAASAPPQEETAPFNPALLPPPIEGEYTEVQAGE